MKIVLNKCYGGFSLSHEAIMLYAKLAKLKLYPFVDDRTKKLDLGKNHRNNVIPYNPKTKEKPFTIYYYKQVTKTGKPVEKSYWHDSDLARDDPVLVKVVEKLGEKSWGMCAELKIVEIGEVAYEIEEYDGMESAKSPSVTYG